MDSRLRVQRAAELAFLGGLCLLPFQWAPRLPVPMMQLCDLFFALAVALLVLARPRVGEGQRPILVLLVLFAAGVAASALVNGGSYLKTLGHFELACLAGAAMILGAEEEAAPRLRLALVLAASAAAFTALAGAVLWAAGVWTPLLNHAGDLLPGSYPRVRGTMVHANQLATLLGVGAVLLWAEPGLLPRRGMRAVVYGAVVAALVLSFSRTIPAVLVAGLGVSAWRRDSRRLKWLFWVALVLLVAAIVASVRFEILLDPSRPWEATLSGEPGTRWLFWQRALANAVAHPVFGIGPGRLGADTMCTHLTWLNLWTLLGVLPLAAFSALVVRAMRPRLWTAGSGLTAALLVLLLASLAGDMEDLRHLWVLLGLALARDPG